MATAPPPARTWRLLAALVALVVALAACGGDDPAADDEPAGDEAASGSVEIDHVFGTTTVDGVPERIVSLDPQWTDVLLALDVTPVGYITSPLQESDHFPWQEDGLDGSEPVNYVDQLPRDAIANLQPDLILVTYAATGQPDYDSLVEIGAPVIAAPTDAEVQPWDELTEIIGRVLHREDDAAALIEETEAAIAAVGEELPGLDGRTIAFVNYVPGDSLWVLADAEDGAGELFADLGLGIAPGIAAEGGDATGRLQLSLERVDLLDGDVLVVLPNGGDVEDLVGWDNLPAVQSGAVATIDQSAAFALNTPSPLSIPYGIDAIRPALEAAA